MLRKSPFIIPSAPVLAKAPPVGREWLHEVKHDGWRAQLHKAGDDVVVFSKTGADFTRRFRSIADAVLKLPVQSCIIDAELVACDKDGNPNFYELMRGTRHGCCAWCFDLMELDGTNHTHGTARVSPASAQQAAEARQVGHASDVRELSAIRSLC